MNLFVRMSDDLAARLSAAARSAGVTNPEAVRRVLDEHLPPAPRPVDPNQLTIGGTS